jgi:uncharacterized protein (DUF2126 family)
VADTSGNVHRSELNIEKLWNPDLPGRGCLVLVDFRAFRMPRCTVGARTAWLTAGCRATWKLPHRVALSAR